MLTLVAFLEHLFDQLLNSRNAIIRYKCRYFIRHRCPLILNTKLLFPVNARTHVPICAK